MVYLHLHVHRKNTCEVVKKNTGKKQQMHRISKKETIN